MTEAKRLYLQTLGLAATNKKGARLAALTRSHLLRQFEIELYWKRANYFWLLQAAVFAAIGFTWKGDNDVPNILPVGLASLGVVTAAAGWLASFGSKFWQQNWEHHIDMLEAEFEGHLYKTVYAAPTGTSWSLTGLNEVLGASFLGFWILALGFVSYRLNENWTFALEDLAWPNKLEIQTFICWAFVGVGLYFLRRKVSSLKKDGLEYSSIEGHKGLTSGPEVQHLDALDGGYLIRRKPKII
jgi:hypothetical protein